MGPGYEIYVQCKSYLSHKLLEKSETREFRKTVQNFSLSLWPTTNHQQTRTHIQKYLQNENAIVFDSLFIKYTDNAPSPNFQFYFAKVGANSQLCVLISIVFHVWFIECDFKWRPKRIHFFHYFQLNWMKISNINNESANYFANGWTINQNRL